MRDIMATGNTMIPRECISCKTKGDLQKGEIGDFCTIVSLGVVTRVFQPHNALRYLLYPDVTQILGHQVIDSA